MHFLRATLASLTSAGVNVVAVIDEILLFLPKSRKAISPIQVVATSPIWPNIILPPLPPVQQVHLKQDNIGVMCDD